jgi:hypothetical protein
MIKERLRSIVSMAVNAVTAIAALRTLMFGLLLIAAGPAVAAEKDVGRHAGAHIAGDLKAPDAALRGAAGSGASGAMLFRMGDERVRRARMRKSRRNERSRLNN